MKILLILFSLLFASTSFANCFGSDNFYTCNDASGNSYTVNKFGNTTMMNGYNANTGSAWNQNSNTLGNTTYINGNTNGRSWSETITPYSTYGTDSQGKSYYYPRR